jgi:undecaprenyl-diphosphatase
VQAVDYRLYHALNQFVLHHEWLGDGWAAFENWAVPALALATVALWAFARPGGERKWKHACTCALFSAGLALLINQAIAKLIWERKRPFAAHPSAHVWGTRSHDPSFPSDHASASFAIGFAVVMFDRTVGGLFLAAAVAIGVGRVFVGEHYPFDVAAGCLVGLAAALVVVKLGRPVIAWLVRMVERATDPVLAPLWRQRG